MNIIRRKLLTGTGAMLVFPALSWLPCISHAKWPSDLFDENNYDDAVSKLLDGKQAKEGSIVIKAPEIAERGAKVPVTVSTDIENVKSISILVDKNPKPFMSKFFISDMIEPYVSVHIKMAESSNVVAIVETESEIFIQKKAVTVTVGGC